MNDLKSISNEIEIPAEQPVPTQEEFRYVQNFPQDDWELELTKLRKRRQERYLEKINRIQNKLKQKELAALQKKHLRRAKKKR